MWKITILRQKFIFFPILGGGGGGGGGQNKYSVCVSCLVALCWFSVDTSQYYFFFFFCLTVLKTDQSTRILCTGLICDQSTRTPLHRVDMWFESWKPSLLPQRVNVRYNWQPFCAAWRSDFTFSISYCKDNVKCDSASNTPKCQLYNGVSIVQKLVVKLSNTSTTFSQQVEITLSKCLRVGQQVFERWTPRLWADI